MNDAPATFAPERRAALRTLRGLAEPGEWVAVQDLHGDNRIAVAGFERTRTIADVRAAGADYGDGNARYLAATASLMMVVLDALDAAGPAWQAPALAELLDWTEPRPLTIEVIADVSRSTDRAAISVYYDGASTRLSYFELATVRTVVLTKK